MGKILCRKIFSMDTRRVTLPEWLVVGKTIADAAEAMRVHGRRAGAFVWPALIRKLDRLDPTCKA